MLFNPRFALKAGLVLLAGSGSVLGGPISQRQALSAQQIGNGIRDLTTPLIEKLIPVAGQITMADAALLLLRRGKYQEVIDGLQDYFANIELARGAIRNNNAFATNEEVRAITQPYIQLTGLHTNLISILTQKAAIQGLVPVVGLDLVKILQQDRRESQMYADAVQRLITGSPNTAILDNTRTLVAAIDTAINAYSGTGAIPN